MQSYPSSQVDAENSFNLLYKSGVLHRVADHTPKISRLSGLENNLTKSIPDDWLTKSSTTLAKQTLKAWSKPERELQWPY